MAGMVRMRNRSPNDVIYRPIKIPTDNITKKAPNVKGDVISVMVTADKTFLLSSPRTLPLPTLRPLTAPLSLSH